MAIAEVKKEEGRRPDYKYNALQILEWFAEYQLQTCSNIKEPEEMSLLDPWFPRAK